MFPLRAFPLMNRLLRLTIIAFAVWMPCTAALGAAARPNDTAPSDPSAVGTFEANGTGTVVINGKQTSYGRFSGRMTVRVLKGNATVRIQGVRQKLTRNATTGHLTFTLTSATSRPFYVSGGKVRLQFVSAPKKRLSVSMFGVARVVVRGSGTYRVNGGAATAWPREQRTVPVRPAVIARLLPASEREVATA